MIFFQFPESFGEFKRTVFVQERGRTPNSLEVEYKIGTHELHIFGLPMRDYDDISYSVRWIRDEEEREWGHSFFHSKDVSEVWEEAKKAMEKEKLKLILR